MAEKPNPLLELEKWATETHYVRRQVGFCAQWCLDNLCKYQLNGRIRLRDKLLLIHVHFDNSSFNGR